MTNPYDKAIEAGAKEMCAAGCEEVPGAIDYHEMDAEEQAIILSIFRRAIAAYEAAMWRPVSGCPDEWKDGRPLLAERAFDGNYKTDLPTYFEVRWRTDGFNFTGFMDFQGRRINATRVRPLPPVPEGE